MDMHWCCDMQVKHPDLSIEQAEEICKAAVKELHKGAYEADAKFLVDTMKKNCIKTGIWAAAVLCSIDIDCCNGSLLVQCNAQFLPARMHHMCIYLTSV